MRKVFTAGSAALVLLLSSQAFAYNELAPRDQKRISTEVHEMQVFLNLSDSDADKLKQIKADMAKVNAQLVQEYGRGTDGFKEARRPHWQAYQRDLRSIVSQDDLRRYNASKKG